MSFAYRVSGTFLMDTGQHQPVQTEALLGCTIVRALRNPGPTPPAMGGFAPMDPPFPTLVGLGFAGVLGPTRGGIANVGYWGTSPMPPGRGLRPLHPHFPTLVGFGLARVLGPTRGGIANVGYSPLLLVLWGDTPHTPRHGGFAPLDPPVLPTPVSLGFARVLGPTRGGVANVGNSPLF